ncbi:DUF5703 domain-containing protein [Roseimarinus sediminis]|uniref:DUF5703 domain-containing protein n=1 Tax=Roseimarinus sediminis TaxID=1610899 RepID=UPI003D1B7E5A
MSKTKILTVIILLLAFQLSAAEHYIHKYNPVWKSSSQNSSESMPCGGGDIGLNVWSEKGDILFYMQQSGAFDENNSFLKAGRVRLQLTPNPFDEGTFHQELVLEEGHVLFKAEKDGIAAEVNIWVDVFNPVIHVEIESNKAMKATATYESWRYADREMEKNESFQNSYKWAPPEGLMMKKDEVGFDDERILFYHQNKGETVFDVTVKQQGMSAVKDSLFNPLENLISGGCMLGENFKPAGTTHGKYVNADFKGWKLQSVKAAKKQSFAVVLNLQKASSAQEWKSVLAQKADGALKNARSTKKATQEWWNAYWNRSFIQFDSALTDTLLSGDVARNYQLFRYMLGCNAYGSYPTRFNGGLFTFDPVFTNESRAFTPDFRNWGGGTFTAQNQRLVYFPMFKSGDTDMLKPQLDFYKNLLGNAEMRSRFYWGHDGASFTEQIENFGLPNPSEYGWKRPDWYDKGMQYNAWLEYQWDTSLEFCYMAILWHQYTGKDIAEYIPMIQSCLTFFDEHYQYLARNRGRKVLDDEGKLVLYPGSSCETYKMATNAVTTVAALKVLTRELLALSESYLSDEAVEKWNNFVNRIPDIEFREIDGHKMIAPARMWERINNTETPQLYPVFPWGMYGVGKPGLELAVNTYKYDPDAQKFRGHESWKQDAIWAARLGLTDEAARLVQLKLGDSGRRFPAFWGPGFDWVPDHNWGGSGMIALQEMLLQTAGDSIILFPAWPKGHDVHFKLHAPQNTVVEAGMKDGKLVKLEVSPAERKEDIIIWE